MKIIILLTLMLAFSAIAEEKQYDLGNGLSVTIIESPFAPSDWNITYCPNSERICLINGVTPNGVDGNMPITYLKILIATINGKQYNLDSSNMFNAWGNRPLEDPSSVKYFAGSCQHETWCTFRGLFSDGAGSFVAEWQVRQGVPERTIITSSNDIVHLFINSIDPPVYE
jgi:hypothetical protein